MLTLDQSNYLHIKMSELEEEVQRTTGLNIHLSFYMRSKKINRMLTHSEAIEGMAEVLGTTLEELRGRNKRAELVLARKVIIAVLRSNFPRISCITLGELLNRDHTTILNLFKTSSDLINTEDEQFKMLFAKAKKALEAQ